MPLESDNHYILPDDLRSELAKPFGQLVEGTIESTIPLLKKILMPKTGKIAGVGDVTADLLVENEFNPDIIITDGKTKRETLETWRTYQSFHELEAKCPAAEITPEAWQVIRKAVTLSDSFPVHIKIYGEEDLLVLPLIIELPNGSSIIYGQPNKGAVIREVSPRSRKDAKSILSKMKIKR